MSILFVLLAAARVPAPSDGFEADFTGRTLRFDYFHSGSATEEHVSLDRLRLEGAWPGSRTRLGDDTNLGKYFFAVVDPETQATLYSRGFCSIYGEWETTGEAKRIWRTFHESLRFPEPRRRVQLVIRKRGTDGAFREIFTTIADPASRFVDRSAVTVRGTVSTLVESGPPPVKVDLLVIADGYTAEQAGKFRNDAARLCDVLFDTEPYKSRSSSFNVRLLHVPAAEAGISNPRRDVWRDAPFGTSFNAFDSDRYVLTYENARLREAAAQAPYDALMILANDRKYGGGGIFNLWATCTADSGPAAYVFVHEFGHSFAGLADEYYSSQVAYEGFNAPGVEPWEPNVTALLDPAALKWRDLVTEGTPLPTPWEQATYDGQDVDFQKRRQKLVAEGATEDAMDGYFTEVKKASSSLLRSQKHFGAVGAFEGAGYEAKGLYRPEVDCIMFTRNPSDYCRVCTRAIERVIGLYDR